MITIPGWLIVAGLFVTWFCKLQMDGKEKLKSVVPPKKHLYRHITYINPAKHTFNRCMYAQGIHENQR